jgi:AcrR family transcriptional regulator
MLTKRQDEIINCALRLVAESGIQNLTVRNLSNRVGISEPAIYRHFKNKSHILENIFKIIEEESVDSVTEIMKSPNSSIDKLQLIFHSRCIFFTNNQDFSTVVFSEEIFRNENELSEKIKAIMQFHRTSILNIITEGQNLNEIRKDIPSEHVCNIFMGVLRLLVTRWRISNFAFNLPKEGLENFDSIKTMLIKE